jgi:hypothetical protein
MTLIGLPATRSHRALSLGSGAARDQGTCRVDPGTDPRIHRICLAEPPIRL